MLLHVRVNLVWQIMLKPNRHGGLDGLVTFLVTVTKYLTEET